MHELFNSHESQAVLNKLMKSPVDRRSTEGAKLEGSLYREHLAQIFQILSARVRRILARRLRHHESVEQNYDMLWSQGLSMLEESISGTSLGYVVSPDKIFLANTFSIKRLVLLFVEKTIQELKPKTVLEVGSGSGINLLYLAKVFPEIQFTGLELTKGGVETGRALCSVPISPRILDWINLERGSKVDDKPPTNLKFVQASAAEMPLADSSFDLSFSFLALEQMPPFHLKALDEIKRVTKKYCVHFEPYRDFNDIRQIIDRKARNDFIEPVKTMEKLGWKQLAFFPVYPHKYQFQGSIYVGQKSQ